MDIKSVAVVLNNGTAIFGKRRVTKYGMDVFAYRVQRRKTIERQELYNNMDAMTSQELETLVDSCSQGGTTDFLKRWRQNTSMHNFYNARKNLAHIREWVLAYVKTGTHPTDDEKLTWTFPGGMSSRIDGRNARERDIDVCVITALRKLEEETGITEQDLIMPPLRIVHGIGKSHDLVFFNINPDSEYVCSSCSSSLFPQGFF